MLACSNNLFGEDEGTGSLFHGADVADADVTQRAVQLL